MELDLGHGGIGLGGLIAASTLFILPEAEGATVVFGAAFYGQAVEDVAAWAAGAPVRVLT